MKYMTKTFRININGNYNGSIYADKILVDTSEPNKRFVFIKDGVNTATLRERDGITVEEEAD